MNRPDVSIIMPCYNAAATLRTALTSILEQSVANFEVIVVDDGSRDDSLAIAGEMAAGDSRIRVMSQANAGPAAARNRGVAEANGEFVAFLDADDRWTPDLLACHMALLNCDPSCGASFARIQFFDPALERPGRLSAYKRRLTLAQVLGENPICTTSNLFARKAVFDAVGSFEPSLTHGEDQEWVARVLATTKWTVRGVQAVLVHYRTSPAGLSADLDRMRDGWMHMFAMVRSYAPQMSDRLEGHSTALFYRFLARRALRTGQTADCVAPMLRAWRASPRTLLCTQPHRTAMTMLGIFAASIPGNPIRSVLAR